MSDIDYMTEAIRLSLESVEAGGGPFGAVIVRDEMIIGRGVNRVTLDGDPTAHAEIVAIRDACASLGGFRLEGCRLYASCEPCPMCLAAAYWARIDVLFFAADRDDADRAGFDDQRLYEQIVLPPDQRRLAAVQLGREDALVAFDAWTNKVDKVPY